MNLKLHSRCQAFTLVEIMVAIAIFAMVMAAVYSTSVPILKATQVGKFVRFLLPDVVTFLATAQEENPR